MKLHILLKKIKTIHIFPIAFDLLFFIPSVWFIIYNKLNNATVQYKPSGIFVSSSRVFRVAEFLMDIKQDKDIYLIGYDLIDNNIKFLEQGVIDILISQKPIDQGYKSVISLFNHMILHKEVNKTLHLPIDIIIKENIKYYINN